MKTSEESIYGEYPQKVDITVDNTTTPKARMLIVSNKYSGGEDVYKPAALNLRGGDSSQFRVLLDKPTKKDIMVKFTISGTADNGVDYEKISNNVFIPAYGIDDFINIKTLEA